jgi:hypothetical protein
MNTINNIQSVTLVSVDMIPTNDSWVASCKAVATRIDGRKYHVHASFEEGFAPRAKYGNLDFQRKFSLGGVRLRKAGGGFVQVKKNAHYVRANIQQAIINELIRTGCVTQDFS